MSGGLSSVHDPNSPWDPTYPIAKNQTPSAITRDEVLEMLRQGQKPGKDFILVDLRQADHTGGTIRGSINLPAQSLYPTLPTLYTLFSRANIKCVIWYCGSSQHRGLRAAAWMDDYIKEQGNQDMKSFMLKGGVKGWAGAGAEYTSLMDEYREHTWRQAPELVT
ncbi:Rhodanese-like protein [Cadophora sp. DSE1049]|nr:Rhodanese-like protein [Cadophora sp. DSE1049]